MEGLCPPSYQENLDPPLGGVYHLVVEGKSFEVIREHCPQIMERVSCVLNITHFSDQCIVYWEGLSFLVLFNSFIKEKLWCQQTYIYMYTCSLVMVHCRDLFRGWGAQGFPTPEVNFPFLEFIECA